MCKDFFDAVFNLPAGKGEIVEPKTHMRCGDIYGFGDYLLSKVQDNKTQKYGLVDCQTGKLLTNCEYDMLEFAWLEKNKGVRLQVEKDGKQGVIDMEENVLIRCEYDRCYAPKAFKWDGDYTNRHEVDALFLLKKGNKYTVADFDGNLFGACVYDHIVRYTYGNSEEDQIERIPDGHTYIVYRSKGDVETFVRDRVFQKN